MPQLDALRETFGEPVCDLKINLGNIASSDHLDADQIWAIALGVRILHRRAAPARRGPGRCQSSGRQRRGIGGCQGGSGADGHEHGLLPLSSLGR